jgi:hypothetical protein
MLQEKLQHTSVRRCWNADECHPEHIANSFGVTHILLASRGDNSGGWT